MRSCALIAALLSIVFASTVDASALKPGAVIYGVVPSFFGERPFVSVTKRLDDLKKQGVDVIWLSPMNQTDDPSAISYSVTDFFALREDLGTPAELKALVRGAHARGIKVIMDFVPNHTSNGHPYFKDAERQGRKSIYYDFFQRTESGEPTYYFDWEHLPNLNYRNAKVEQMITEAFQHWIREFDLDGFRVDVAWGVKERAPEFWPKLRRAIEKIKPDLIMLAEAGIRDPYYTQNGFDLAYDWGENLGNWAWRDIFNEPSLAGEKLRSVFKSQSVNSEKTARFLNNNDTGERFVTQYGVPMQKAAAVLQHMIPGIPIVYTGDEVAAEFEPYEDPGVIDWTDRHNLKSFYKKLADLRESQASLREGTWEILEVKEPSVFAFVRRAKSSAPVLSLINFDKPTVVEVPVQGWSETTQALDLLSGRSKKVRYNKQNQSISIELKAFEPLLLQF